MQRDRYPPDWEAISLRVRAEAGNKCQRCGVPNGAYILRVVGDPMQWIALDPADLESQGERIGTKIVLTVAHTGPHKHDKMDCSSLEALCQRCHLLEDLDDHIRHAAETRRRKRMEAGQVALLEYV